MSRSARSALSRASFDGTGPPRSTAQRFELLRANESATSVSRFGSGHVHASYTRPAGDTSQRCPDASLATATISSVSLAAHRAAAMALDRVRYEPEPWLVQTRNRSVPGRLTRCSSSGLWDPPFARLLCPDRGPPARTSSPQPR